MKKYIIPIAVFFAFTARAYASLDISEIMYDPKGPNAGHQWIEVYNSGPNKVLIDDTWRFNDGSSHYINNKKALDIPPSSYFILTGNKETFLSDHPSYVGLVVDTSMSLHKDRDTVSLLKDGAIVAGVSYASSAGGSQNDNSLQKIDGTWVEAKPTPGVKNTVPDAPVEEIPEPQVPSQPILKPAPLPAAPIETIPPESPVADVPVAIPIQKTPPAPIIANPTQVSSSMVGPASSVVESVPPIIAAEPSQSSIVHTSTTPAVSVLQPDPPRETKTATKKKSKASSVAKKDTKDTTAETPVDLSTINANAIGPTPNSTIPMIALAGLAIVVFGFAGLLFFHKNKRTESIRDRNDIEID